MNDFSIHPSADVQTHHIGQGSRIWQHVVVLANAVIGKDVNVCAHCFIENDVVIGDRVTIKSGVYLWDGLRVGDDVFIGPNATFTNDRFPRSKQYPEHFAITTIESGASIGAGAILLPGITVGKGAMVGAGAVVTRSVPPYAIVKGSPARITGYVEQTNIDKSEVLCPADLGLEADSGAPRKVGVGEVSLHKLKTASDIRGDLVFGEFTRDLPIVPKRYFLVFDVPSEKTRGEHAHYKCEQFLICVKGSCCVVVDDGKKRMEVVLDSPDIGIFIPPMIWSVQYKYSRDAALLVFASDYYEADDYIRNYHDFLAAKDKQGEA